MTDSLSQPWVTIVLATLAPTAAFVALNLRFFTLRQAVVSLALSALVAGMLGAGAALLCEWVSHLSLSVAAAAHGISVAGGLTTLLALCLYFILHERFFTEALPHTYTRRLVMAALMLVLGLCSIWYSQAVINGVLMILLVSSCLDAMRQRNTPKEPLFALSTFRQYYTPRSARNVILTHKANVYLLLLESYHSSEALQTLYGIDDSATDAIFAKHGFTDSPGVYSNEPATVASLHTLVDGTLLGSVPHARDNAFIFDVLRENGYSCEFFDSSFFVFGHLMAEGEYASFDMPTYVRLLYTLAGPLWAQSRYLRKIVNNFDPFETEINFSVMFDAFQKRLAHKGEKPRFFCMRFGACHVENSHQSWLEDASQFQEMYKEFARGAQEQIAQVVESIMQHDPDALVVAVGDHGSLRHSNAWRGAGGMDKVLLKRGVSMATLALDHFGVRLAIRWSVPHKTTGKVISHVNIFRYVLEALGGGKDLLEHFSRIFPYLKGNMWWCVMASQLSNSMCTTPRKPCNLCGTVLKRGRLHWRTVLPWLTPLSRQILSLCSPCCSGRTTPFLKTQGCKLCWENYSALRAGRWGLGIWNAPLKYCLMIRIYWCIIGMPYYVLSIHKRLWTGWQIGGEPTCHPMQYLKS